MKKTLYIICSLLAFAGTAFAQNPKEMVVTVEYKNEAGEIKTLEISDISKNSFSFVGGKGKVQYIYNGEPFINETCEEDNKDVFAFQVYVNPFDALFVMNTNGEFDYAGMIISKESIPADLPEFEARATWSGYWNYFSYSIDDKLANVESVGITTSDVYEKHDGTCVYPFRFLGLEYMTKYYCRPYVRLQNGEMMYGAEKSFTTTRTIEAALENDPQLAGNYFFDKETGLCFTGDMLKQIVEGWGYSMDNINQYQLKNIGKLFLSTLTKVQIANIASSSKESIECVDGKIIMINAVSSQLVADAKTQLEQPILFDPSLYVNYDLSSKGEELYTKYCTVDVQEGVTGKGLAFDKYLYATPKSSSSNPFVGIDFPRGLLPGDYTITITFAPDVLSETPLPNRVYIGIYERITEEGTSQGAYQTTGTRIPNPDGSGNYFMPNNATTSDSVSFDFTVSDSFASDMIQVQSQVTSKLASTYDRSIRIASIEVTPKK